MDSDNTDKKYHSPISGLLSLTPFLFFADQQVFVSIRFIQAALHFADETTALKDGLLKLNSFSLRALPSKYCIQELLSFVQIVPQTYESVHVLSICSPRFPHHLYLTSAETDVRIALIGLVKLQKRAHNLEVTNNATIKTRVFAIQHTSTAGIIGLPPRFSRRSFQ
jgi:hypothetical protein